MSALSSEKSVSMSLNLNVLLTSQTISDSLRKMCSVEAQKEDSNASALQKLEQTRPHPKPSKPKAFQEVLQNLAIAGINPMLSERPYPFNGKIFMGFLILGSSMICNFKYILCEANTFIEYTQNIFMGSLAVLIIFALVIIIRSADELFEYIDDCGNLVAKIHASQWTISI